MNKLFGNLGLGAACTVQLEFQPPAGSPPLPTIALADKSGGQQTTPVYSNKDTVCGQVKVTPTPGKRVDHQGIRVQLVGEIELASERGHPHEFISLVRELSPPGDLHTQQILPFEFKSVEMEYESYKGTQVRLRYALRVSVVKGLGQSVVKDFPFWVRNPVEAMPAPGPPIKMEVGIEDCLHIEFEYDRAAYHLGDTVVGKIYFLLVRIKLKYMELEIRRRETVGGGSSARSETETVAKYEIMDGAPVRGEVIPIRLYLEPYDLTPSYPNVHNKFGAKYSLNLVLVDEEDRRYFKQQEITLYRLREGAAGEGSGWPAPLLPRPAGVSAASVAGTASEETGPAGSSAAVAAEETWEEVKEGGGTSGSDSAGGAMGRTASGQEEGREEDQKGSSPL